MKKGKCIYLDYIIASVIGIGIGFLLYMFLGFYKVGLDTPYQYVGGDDFTGIVKIKNIGENGWFWTNDYLGAPYNFESFDFPASFATNVENLIAKIVYIFTQNAVVTQNIQFLLNFSISGMVAYFVFREFELERLVAAGGASLYGLAPYILGRNVMHLTLGSVYCIPLTVMLCVWASENDDKYLKFDKYFFRYKRNIISIICMVFIANNGLAYYQFFSCFFMCIICVYKFFVYKNWRAVLAPLKSVILIVAFFVGALLPVLAYKVTHESLGVAVRHVQEAEIYGLKISQFFVPLNSHGIAILDKLISVYNSNMPLVNENQIAYLGLGGIVGFICVIITLLIDCSSRRENSQITECRMGQKIQLMSKLVLFAILLATVGGFSSILSLLGFRSLRCYNRISIYVMFLCLSVMCFYIQKARCFIKSRMRIKKQYGLVEIVIISFFMICVLEQLPQWGARDVVLAQNKELYESDASFVSGIESQLQSGDAVFQLPYHKYPESGSVNRMNDYHLLTGYLHSQNIKWSYGSMKGSEGDRWSEYVSSLPIKTMLEYIIPAGFRGIYIDSRAYTSEQLNELMSEIEAVLGEEPYISANGNLIFYNLYSYIEKNSNLLNLPFMTIEDIEKGPYTLGDIIWFYSDEYNSNRYTQIGLSEKEAGFSWTDGSEVIMNYYIVGECKELILHGTFETAAVYNNQQYVRIYVNEVCVYDNLFVGGNIEFDFEKPTDNIVNIRIELPYAISPAEMGQSQDSRKLALALKTFCITTKEYMSYEIDKMIFFYSGEYNASKYVKKGLSSEEATHSWTDGNEFQMEYKVQTAEAISKLHACFETLWVFNNQQRVIIYVNDVCIFDDTVTGGNIEFDFDAPPDGIVNIRMELPDAVSPLELGQSQDARKLALALKTFQITPAE